MECERISIQWFISIFIENILDFNNFFRTTNSLFKKIYPSNFKKFKHQLGNFATFTILKDTLKLIILYNFWKNNPMLEMSD